MFGHYLSSFLDPDGISDSKKSTIIRKIWDDYSNLYGNYSILEIIDSKLKEELGVPFIDAWTDFISRNISHLKNMGIDMIDSKPREGLNNTLVAFAHPKSMNSVLIELAQKK